MTEVEAEWDEESRAVAVTLIDLEADACSGCGQPLSETLKPDAAGAYEAQLPARCHACDALYHRQKDYADVPHLHALRFGVRRKPDRGGDGNR